MRQTLLLAACATLASCATGPNPSARQAAFLGQAADPGKVVATEIAFAREASEKGTWTAFRRYATGDAIWPGPRWENVQAALKGVADPAQPITWGPDRVWSSCDGSYAFSTGPSRTPAGRDGRFTTIWQLQDDGSYRWVLDQGFGLESSYAKPDMIPALVADCPATRRTARSKARRGLAWQDGSSDDGTLSWSTTLFPDCRRELVIRARQGSEMIDVFRRTSDAPKPPEGTKAPSCA